MTQYIDKDALVAEIIRRRKAIPKEEEDKRLKAVYGNEAFVLTELLEYIDTLEVKEVDLDFEQELYKAFGQVKDFTLGMRIAKWFYDMGKNNQEHVSEDLEEAAKSYSNNLDNICGSIGKQTRNAFKAGAKWKEQQFEKNRLSACDKQTEEEAEIEQSFVMGIIEKEHRQPTFDDAIKYGMRLQKKQIINDAYEREVKVDAGGYPYIPQMELYDYDKDVPLAKMGDKYKVVLIKED